MKKLILVLMFFLVGSCGFSPLYAQKESGQGFFGGTYDTSISDEMAKVKIEPIGDRFGQLLRNKLLDLLTPLGVPSKPKYRLYVELKSRNVYEQALREDITATREMIVFKVDYYLKEGNKQLFKNNSVAYVSYDILKNPYSTTIAEQKAEKNAAQIIANDISLGVGAYFHSRITKQGPDSDL